MADETTDETSTERDSFKVTAVVTTGSGERLPVEITLRYPAGRGLTAASAITHDAPDFFGEMAEVLLRSGDAEAVEEFKRHQAGTLREEAKLAETFGKSEG